ncbi:MAG: hypothetical protein JO353_03710 [Phycisphaerae bacterium]|nr:hypothetical protein [Phycisphaerae bacterium]
MAAVLSSQVMVHFMPSAIFSIFMVQRGSIIPFMPFIIDGIIIPLMGIPICMPIGMAIPIICIRSVVVIVFITLSLGSVAGSANKAGLIEATVENWQ